METKLTYQQAQEIRDHIHTGYVTIDMLSRQYKVSNDVIYGIITNKTHTRED